MTIKPSLAAFTAVSSAVLIFGNTAYAEGANFLGYPPTPAANQVQVPAPVPGPETPVEFPIVPPPPKPISLPAAYKEKLPEPAAIATEVHIATTSTSTATSRSAFVSSPGNTYTWGQCTWYVKNKRPDLPNGLGNGGRWVANAAARGFATGTTPRAGAVGEQPGHVVYIESVNGNGTVNISEMNYNGRVGVVHTRTVAASMFRYIY
jgi:surface antigen